MKRIEDLTIAQVQIPSGRSVTAAITESSGKLLWEIRLQLTN